MEFNEFFDQMAYQQATKGMNEKARYKISNLMAHDSVNYEAFKILFNITKEYYSDENEPEIVTIITELLMTLSSFKAFRKLWSPQGHASQHDTFDLDLDYTERLLRKMYRIKKQRIDDGWYESDSEIIGALTVFEEGEIICNS
jgi:hypothetical protein